MKPFTLIFLLLFTSSITAQVVYESTSHTAIYELLDELANEKLISVNAAVKPWSRAFIAEKLQEALDQKDALSRRQLEDIEFYMQDYRLELLFNTNGMKPLNIFPKNEHVATSLDPLAFTYRDSLFALSLRPVWGMEVMTNKNNTAFHHRLGIEGFGYFRKHLGVYADYSYNYENVTLSDPGYFSRRPGAVTDNYSDGSLSFQDMRWGVVYSLHFGSVGVVKDRPQWGSGYYGTNILSGKAPAFIQLELKLNPARWFSFSYLHGWLESDVVDSSRSYWNGNTYEEVMRPKYIAANIFTITPVPNLNISLGSSTIYSDGPVQAAYLVPFLFFRSADYEISGMRDNASANSQIFFNVSSRNIRHLHLYFSLFVDELSVYRLGKSDRHNFLGYKGGFRLGNWPLDNLSLTAELTYTLPMVYQHKISTITFASDGYSMGHYMRDNAYEFCLSLCYRPLRGLRVELSYALARHGNDYRYGEYTPVDAAPILKDITWQKNVAGLQASYALLSNASVFAAAYFSNVQGFAVDGLPPEYYLSRYSPEIFHGKNLILNTGVSIGF